MLFMFRSMHPASENVKNFFEKNMQKKIKKVLYKKESLLYNQLYKILHAGLKDKGVLERVFVSSIERTKAGSSGMPFLFQ